MESKRQGWLAGTRGYILLALLVYAVAMASLFLYRQQQRGDEPRKSWAYYLPSGGHQSQDLRRDGLLLVRCADSRLCAVRDDGSVAWEYTPPSPIYEFISSFVMQDDMVMLALADKSIVLLDARDGRLITSLKADKPADQKLAAASGGSPADLIIQSEQGSWGLTKSGEIAWTRPDLKVEEPPRRMQQNRDGLLMAVRQQEPRTEIVALKPDGTELWTFEPWGKGGPGRKVQVTGLSDFYFGAKGQIYAVSTSSASSFNPPQANGSFMWFGYFDQQVENALLLALDREGRRLWQRHDQMRYGDCIYPQPDGSLYCLSQRMALLKLDSNGKEIWRRTYPDGLHNFTLSSSGEVYLQLAPKVPTGPPSWMYWLPMQTYNYTQSNDFVVVVDAQGDELHRWEMAQNGDWLTAAMNDNAGIITCESYTSNDNRDLVSYRWEQAK